MSWMFYKALAFNQDLGDWAVQSVTDMRWMFQFASAFNQDIGDWATHNVKDMRQMFDRASVFNQDLSDWRFDKLTDMRWMFQYASAFNQDIGDWPVHSVTSMYQMFYRASAFDQDLGWCVDDYVSLTSAFSSSGCESTSCGVTQVEGGCAPTPSPTMTPAPTTTPVPTVPLDDTSLRMAVAAVPRGDEEFGASIMQGGGGGKAGTSWRRRAPLWPPHDEHEA